MAFSMFTQVNKIRRRRCTYSFLQFLMHQTKQKTVHVSALWSIFTYTNSTSEMKTFRFRHFLNVIAPKASKIMLIQIFSRLLGSMVLRECCCSSGSVSQHNGGPSKAQVLHLTTTSRNVNAAQLDVRRDLSDFDKIKAIQFYYQILQTFFKITPVVLTLLTALLHNTGNQPISLKDVGYLHNVYWFKNLSAQFNQLKFLLSKLI